MVYYNSFHLFCCCCCCFPVVLNFIVLAPSKTNINKDHHLLFVEIRHVFFSFHSLVFSFVCSSVNTTVELCGILWNSINCIINTVLIKTKFLLHICTFFRVYYFLIRWPIQSKNDWCSMIYVVFCCCKHFVDDDDDDDVVLLISDTVFNCSVWLEEPLFQGQCVYLSYMLCVYVYLICSLFCLLDNTLNTYDINLLDFI